MKCKECDGERFMSRYDRKTKERIAYVCVSCGAEIAEKKKYQSKSDKAVSDDKGLENNIEEEV